MKKAAKKEKSQKNNLLHSLIAGTRLPAHSTMPQQIPQLLAQAFHYIQTQQWLLARDACNNIIALDANHAEAYHLAGHVAGRLGDSGQAGQHELALTLLKKAISLDPRQSQYRYNLAVSLGMAGRENEAAVAYQACLRIDPNHKDALWNYGEMLRMAEHFHLAAPLFERFAAQGGNYPALRHRLAVSYGALNLDAQADACFRQELTASDMPDMLTRWEYALFLLGRERFAEGFAHYQQRFLAGGRNSVFCHPFPQPRWQGTFTHGSTLLVHGEQGLGDEMMFASVLPEVLQAAQQMNSRVILAVKPSLVRLFASSFPAAIVRPHSVGGPAVDVSDLGDITWQLPIGDLAVLLRQTLEDFAPARQPYLFADAGRAAWYAMQLRALEPIKSSDNDKSHDAPVLKVGIMWGSNPAPINSKFMRWSQQRSIPVGLFERLAHLVPAVRFVSLQNAERGAEAALAPGLDIYDLSEQQTDFFETAALIANLDLVISVDTSISHLAGAMGVETWVPLMHRCDWRHGKDRSHSYWYSNTRYFHQTASGQWPEVIEVLEQALRERLTSKETLKNSNSVRAEPFDGLRTGSVEALTNQTLALRQAQGERVNIPSTKMPEPLSAQATASLQQATHYLGLRQFDQARPHFEAALLASNDSEKVKWEYAMQLLTERQWARGWDYHEARHTIFGWQGLNLCPLPWPIWAGQPLSGRTVVVHGEQGTGDEIMNLSTLPDLINTGANIVLACAPGLVGLMQANYPSIHVVAHPRGSQVPSWQHSLPAWVQELEHSLQKQGNRVDFHIPTSSLPRYFRRSDADFTRQAYLQADPARVAHMAQQLALVAPAGADKKAFPKPLRIGLAWCGSLGDANARNRSVEIGKLQPIIALAQARGWQLVSLQSRQYANQLQQLPNYQIVDMSEHTDDFADLAALMANLDVIITVDTSYGHLAAALGLKTWRMVIKTCDWRWGWGREDSVWYPHDRLFRQPEDGDWDAVIAKITAELESMI